jgi:predicted phage terminase large subunit-like protein
MEKIGSLKFRPGTPQKIIDAAKELLFRQKLKSSLAEYARLLGFEPAKHHLLIINHLEDIANDKLDLLLIFAPPGSAKALALDTPIPTPSGWSTMGELKVGDQVFDDQGNPCNVIRKTEIFKDRPLYKLKTNFRETVIADEDHDWVVYRTTHSKYPKIEKTKTIATCNTGKRPFITPAKPLNLPPVDLPIDPYVLGVWLGDGSKGSVRITQGDQDREWMKAEIRRLGYQVSDKDPFTILGVRDKFVKLGLLDDPWHATHGKKHIPPIYLRASIEQREALLQGLIDTDGYVNGCTEFTNINENIAKGVYELAVSLGVKASLISTDYPFPNSEKCYKVTFFYENSARMPRKKQKATSRNRSPNIYVEAEPYGFGDTVCIEVDSPNHMFLCGRAMIPTHNSTYVSVLFPAWYLSNQPMHNFLFATHNSEFANKWGKKVRNDIMLHSSKLEISVSQDNAAADRWALTQGGEYYSVGAGAGISGFRADIACIDDPFGSREDAYSPLVRQKRWDWYLDDFSARMKPSAKRIVMATRWHEEDISGRILEKLEIDKKKGEDFGLRSKVLSIPAICESENDPLGRKIGEYLWDEPPWNYGHYLRIRQRESSPMMWSALFQQRPAPESGDYFREEWLKDTKITMDPKVIHEMQFRIYGASDYATTHDAGDYTVHLVVGLDHNENMYLLDVWRGQASPDVWINEFCRLVKKWEPLEWGEERGQIRNSVGPFLARRQVELDAYTFRRSFPAVGADNKVVRAQSIRGRMAVRGLYVNKQSFFFEPFRAELMSFPAGRHDDHVDALSLIGQMTDHIIAGEAPPAPPPRPRFLEDITLDELWRSQDELDKPNGFNLRI